MNPPRRTVLVAVLVAVGGLALVAALAFVLFRDTGPAEPEAEGGPARSQPGDATRTPFEGFGEVAVTIAGPASDGDPADYCLLLAETSEQRQRGLMGVTDLDLGGYDGMLFRFDGVVEVGFWMKDTPMPLTVAYIGDDGSLVSTADMEPCTGRAAASDCPTYPPEGPYRWALEVPQGRLADIGLVPGATFTDTGEACG